MRVAGLPLPARSGARYTLPVAFLKRVFSSDFRRGLSAEAAGEYLEAARAYALAGERVKVAEMHLLAADKASGREARLDELRAAARWGQSSGDDPEARPLVRRIAHAILDVARGGGATPAALVDRALVREAAGLLSRAGDEAGAGQALELGGDEEGAADAYQAAGEVERLEQVLGRDEERRHRERLLREAGEQFQLHQARGERGQALLRLRQCLQLAPSAAARQQLEELEARRLAGGVVALRLLPGEAPVLHAGAGAFPFGLGREPACAMVLRDTRISRRHAEVVARPGGGFSLRDCGSRNGTLLDGLRIDGELPLGGGGRIGLGDAVELVFSAAGDELALQVTRGADRGLRARLSTGPMALDGGLRLRFEGGVPVLDAASRPPSALRLNGAVPGPAIELCRGDRVELLDGATVLARLEAE